MEAVCGDRVSVRQVAPGQGLIEAVDTRASVLFRRDAMREKVIAANVTQLVYVLAGDPPFSDELLSRCLVAAEAAGIVSLVALNKCDLGEPSQRARAQLAPFRAIGCTVLELTAKPGRAGEAMATLATVPAAACADAQPPSVDALRERLTGHTSLLIGQSGMGKSTLINALVPGANAVTGEISRALSAGKHTTTSSRMYRLAPDSALIDSPGLQAFGLAQVPIDQLAYCFVEFRPALGHCRFDDCTHRHEPGCAVRALVDGGRIDARRLQIYARIVEENAYAARQSR